MENKSGLYDRIGQTMRKMQHFPAFIMFVVVLTAASLLNYQTMSGTVGEIAAVTIAGFFGFGVLAWHIVENRTDDSRYQEDVAKSAKWINAGLDATLLVINLFREDTSAQLVAGITTWDAAAYLIIGLSAVTHVVCFLLWSQADPRKALQKRSERDLNEIAIKRQASEISIQSAEAELKAIRYVTDEEIRLRHEYADLPKPKVDAIVMKLRAAANYTLTPETPRPVRVIRPTTPPTEGATILNPQTGKYISHSNKPEVPEDAFFSFGEPWDSDNGHK